LEVGRQYVITWLLSPVDWGRSSWAKRGSSPNYPCPTLPQTPPEGHYSKNSFLGLQKGVIYLQ
jgi:hypothetical protein